MANLCKAFANKSSTGIKLSKTQLPKMIQSGGFLGRLLGPLLKAGLTLMKNVTKPLAKSVSIPLELTAAVWAADVGIHKKILASGRRHSPSSASYNTTLILSNDEMEDINKIVKYLEDSGLLLKRDSKTVQNEPREQRGRFLSVLLGTLRASSLGNILAVKGINRAGEGVIRAGHGNKKGQKNNSKRDF